MPPIDSPSWQFYGIIIGAFLAVSVPLFGAWWNHRKQSSKNLQYEVIYNGPLFLLTDRGSGRIKVSFDNKPIPNANLIIVSISNSGNIPIETGNFEHPVILGVPENVEIVHAEIAITEPENIKAQINKTKSTIELLPTLLNGKDKIVIKFIINKPTNEIVIDSRIVGIDKPTPRKYTIKDYWQINSAKFMIFFILSQLFSMGLSLLFLVVPSLPTDSLEHANKVLAILRPLSFLLLMSSGMVILLILSTYGGYVRLHSNTKVLLSRPKIKS